MQELTTKYIRKPDWLKVRLPNNKSYINVKQIVSEHKLHTICESGNCPNIGECWGAGTATFLILGNICTRSCRFCAVKTGKPFPPDVNEPENVANSIKLMNLKHCVLTSVDRDDLPDGGANHWAKTIKSIRNISPETTIESLIPDFKGETKLLDFIIDVKPEIVSHNLETVRRLTKEVRIQAKYERSLDVLKYLSENGINTKSGIMLGLGETEEEIFETMDDILKTGCKIITIGQYLQPSSLHLPVQKFPTPDEFNNYHQVAINKGFKFAECAPLVRSSYHAEKHI
ncbi:MAG: lipoyl synthase [Bacteroidetes bacterium GWA2_31_9]|nr:MAG: lipoyl synthase [Bacteroidetes bacterium GWA2_31_9]